MNKVFRVIWSGAKEKLVVAAESVKTCGARPLATVCAISLAALLAGTTPALALDSGALPTGGKITAGSGSIAVSGQQMTVNQSTQRMIANWKTFNIGQDADVRFNQPNSTAAALNRISDQNPSQILGHLSANGQVFLLNPSGIIFGKTATVNVGGLAASSLQMSDKDFLAGKYQFSTSGKAGAIDNQGALNAVPGGVVALIAPKVSNEGTISAKDGSAVLAAGDKVSLDFGGDGLINYTVDEGAIDAQVANHGLIKAGGGLVVMTAKAKTDLTSAVVNNTGIVQAHSMTEKNGRIILDGQGGTTSVSGTLDASSATGTGGSIVATGDRVLVKNGAHLNASGASGGGEVLVGGGWHGGDGTIHQATGTVVEKGALLEANATDRGDGGTVVAWSDVTDPDSVTRAYGTFEAKGGPNGGDGGRIETSGHWLDVSGVAVATASPEGAAGQWLLDPYNVTIGSIASGDIYSPPDFSPSTQNSTILASDIDNALGDGTNVTITTGSFGPFLGDITVDSPISSSVPSDTTLTLQAADSIIVNQPISNSGSGKLNVKLLADNNNGTHDGVGIIMLYNDIDTGGGNLQFGDGSTQSVNGVNTMVGGDVYVGGSSAVNLTTGGGAVNVHGEMIVANSSGLTINSNGGDVHFYGLLDSGDSYAYNNTQVNWNVALADAKSGTGANVGDTYLTTITSRLENSVASFTANYQTSWLGGHRGVTDGTSSGTTLDADWRWVSGPEGLANGGDGTIFFHQTNTATGTAYGYTNWNSGEPNNCTSGACGVTNYTVTDGENALQFTGNSGVWNDEPDGIWRNTTHGYNIETNLAASPVTINSGSGKVTFSSAVGSTKALASLDVTASGGIAINGGAVTTEGLQTYTGNVTLGSAATTLTQTDADTDFTLPASKTISNASGGDASLTIKTTRDIILDSSSSISSSNNKLNTVLWADSDANSDGMIYLNNATINTQGGNLWMGGGNASGTPWNGLTVGDGYAVGNATVSSGIGINACTINTAGGNIAIYGKGRNGVEVDPVGFGSNTDGIRLDNGNTIDSGTGTIYMKGIGQSNANGGAANGGAANGIELSNIGVDLIKSANTTADAIYMYGESATNPGSSNEWGIYTWANTIEATGAGGGITLEGKGYLQNGVTIPAGGSVLAASGPITLTGLGYGSGSYSVEIDGNVGSKANTDVASSSSNIIVNADLLSLSGTIASTGTLTIEPYTAGRAINIGTTGAGTLNIASSYFSTNFTPGFSGITVGNANAGALTFGSNAVTFNDDTTLMGSSVDLGTASLNMVKDLTIESTNGNIVPSGNVSITKSSGTDATLTLQATGYISLAADSYIGSTSFSMASGNSTTIQSIANKLNLIINPDCSDADANHGGFWLPVGSSITTNGGAVTIGGGSGAADMAEGVADNSYENNALYRGATLNGTIDAGGGNISIQGKGATTGATAARGVSIGGTLQTSGTGAITVEGTGYGASDGLSLGDGSVGVDGILTAGSGTITLNGTKGTGKGINISTASSSISTDGNLVMTSVGAISSPGSITAGGITSLTATGYDITANNSGNDFTGAVSVASADNLSLIDSNAMSLGAVTAAGTVDVATLSGDLTLTGAIATNDTTAGAITLNAGKDAAAGTASGGNIIVSGGSVTTGNGGRATLYTGSVSGSTGLTALVGSGSGHFRYDSDETTTNYSDGLGSGVYAVYREQPVLNVAPSAETMTYGDSAPAFTASYSGYVNGDISPGTVSGTPAWSIGGTTSTSGKYTAGSHDVGYSSGLTSSLGYGFADDTSSSNELTVDKLALSGSISAESSTYGDALAPGTASFSNVVSGDDLGTAMTVSVDYTGADESTSGHLKVGSYTQTASGTLSGADAASYSFSGFTTPTANYTVTPATLTATGTQAYDGSTLFNGSHLSVSGVDGETFTATGSGTLSSKNVQSNQPLASVTGLSLSGNNGALTSNYDPLSINDTSVSVTPKTVDLSATKTYDGTTDLTGDVTIATGVGGETLNYTNTTANSTHVADNTTNYISGITLADGTGLAGNYQLPALNHTNAPVTVNPKTLTAGISGNPSKAYDGTVTATLIGSDYTMDTGVTGDGFTITQTQGSYNSADVLSADTVTASLSSGDFTPTGSTQASDYTLPASASGAGTITPATLTITADDASKIYDGQAYSHGNGVTYSGFVNNESSSVLGGSLSYGGTSQGAINRGIYTIVPSGLTSDNYAITYQDGSLTITLVKGRPDIPTASNTIPVDSTTPPSDVVFGGPGGTNNSLSGDVLTGPGGGSVDNTRIATPFEILTHQADIPIILNSQAADIKFNCTGGNPPYHWRLLSGSLPLGMHLDANSGEIVGKAKNTGKFQFTLKAKDASGNELTRQYTIIVR